MLRSRGISESIRYAYNPLPAVHELELLKAAHLDELLKPSRKSPFEFVWKYSTGLTMETVELQPGEFLPLRASEAQEFERATNATDLGMCVVSKPDPDNADTRKAAIAALTKAAQFYFDAGQKQIIHQRKRHNYTEQDMVEMRHQFWAYHLNRAKELAIRAELTRLRAPKGKAA